MPELEDNVERIIVATIWRHPKADPATLARMIVEELWETGYDVTPRPDVIPIRHNPSEDAAF
jgi:hypothetical protein